MAQYHDIELNGGSEASHSYVRGISAANQGPSNVLANYNDQTLRRDAKQFAVRQLGMSDRGGEFDNFIRAAFVARDIDIYYAVARGIVAYAPGELDVDLTEEEMVALQKEKDKLFSERGITMVNLAVSLAAMLQGHVQSSINGSSLYASKFGIHTSGAVDTGGHQWQLGAVNAVPFFTAAVLGCWLALPVNDRLGRRGGMMVSAVLIFISSLLAGLTALILKEEDRWKLLVGVRVVNGIVSTLQSFIPPLSRFQASLPLHTPKNELKSYCFWCQLLTPYVSGEAHLCWRGNYGNYVYFLGNVARITWMLIENRVSFGIMIGFVLNLIFAAIVHSIYGDRNQELIVSLILGAPLIFSIAMLGAVWRCPESPRYYLRGGRSKYDPRTAYEKLKQLRSCELLAMKDIYLLHKTIEQEGREIGLDTLESSVFTKLGQLFTRRRLRNALISTSVVNLSQQLCGINVAAFYSGDFFVSVLSGNNKDLINYDSIIWAMIFSFGFGAVNFFFGLPAFKSIDTLGRRKWLVWTLPLMSFFMLAGALSFPIPWEYRSSDYNTVRMVAFWLYLHAAVYSPGLDRTNTVHTGFGKGCAFAIAVNLGFAGLLTIVFPTINNNLRPSGSLGLFAGFNFVAFVLVFLLVEETKELSLEDLSRVLNVPKHKFIQHQVAYVNWFVKRYFFGSRNEMVPEMDNGAGTQQINSGRMQIPEVEDRSFRTHSEMGSRVSSSRSVSSHHVENYAH
ncbi:hypothetical protein RRF57_004938 [Xylaria bambusicola]|uniref:Major facilitator superfamily (MFS) profile domain-containing protein n=1 Tax=Xylaria bambusicola TaxID=326684 RepID=A0AAN7UL31_9PEZI